MLDDDDDASETVLTDDEITILNSLPKTAEKDATFVRLLLSFLYKNDLHVLKTARSFTGRTRKSKKTMLTEGVDSPQANEFKAISPKKKNMIFNLFKNRIEKSGVSKQEQFSRIGAKNLSQLVSKGISNLRLQSEPLSVSSKK